MSDNEDNNNSSINKFKNLTNFYLKNQKYKNLLIAVSGVFALMACVYAFKEHKKKITLKELDKKEVTIQTAKEAVPGDQLWFNDFEQKLIEEKEAREKELSLTKKMLEATQETLSKANSDISNNIQNELLALKAELENLRKEKTQEIRNIESVLNQKKNELNSNFYKNIGVTSAEERSHNAPQDISGYIPAGSYVTGRLLSGVVASTGVRAEEEPHPITIKLTDNAKLPNNFGYDIKLCHVIGSARGVISSERVFIRLETLSCVDKKQKAIETKISGHVVGPDGIEGIKGEVVSMDTKHLTNAAIAGALGGFANAMQPSNRDTQIRIVNGQKDTQSSFLTNAGNNAVSNLANTVNTLADYHIKFAESIQPVIQIPSATQIELVFLQGVQLGSKNIARVINNERQR